MSIVDELFRIDGKVALVTGASSGIGRAMALYLAEAGAKVVHAALGSETKELEDTVSEAEAAGGKAAHVTCDVSRLDELPDLAAAASEPFGPPQILVNAAGVNLRQPWQDVTIESWNKTIAINLTAPFFLARELVPGMQAKKWGKIINIASLQSLRAFPNSAPYGASKGGVMQLTRAMAEAWSKDQSGITCNAIGPGFFRTGLTAPLFNQPEVIASLAKQTIIGRNGDLSDLKGVTIFLASRASDYITGQTIFLDGGWTAK